MTKAIILAAGYSKRINLKMPKQLVKIGARPLITYTLDVFQRHKAIDSIILVAPKKHIPKFNNLIKKYGYEKIEQLCPGGSSRQQSVFKALRKVRNCDYVVIHDGVRPFITPEIISKVIEAAKGLGAATCAVRAIDTIVEAKGHFINSVPCRNKLWHIQTPQAFKFNLIYQAHRKAYLSKTLNSTDDTQLVLKFADKVSPVRNLVTSRKVAVSNGVRLIKGDYKNLKITTPDDLYLAKRLLQNKQTGPDEPKS